MGVVGGSGKLFSLLHCASWIVKERPIICWTVPDLKTDLLDGVEDSCAVPRTPLTPAGRGAHPETDGRAINMMEFDGER
jgi:hypothetical protein